MNEIKKQAEKLYIQMATGIVLLARTSPANKLMLALSWKRAWELCVFLITWFNLLKKDKEAMALAGDKLKQLDMGKRAELEPLLSRCVAAEYTPEYALCSLDLALFLETHSTGLSEIFDGLDKGELLNRSVPEPRNVALFSDFRAIVGGKNPISAKQRAADVNERYQAGLESARPVLVEPRLSPQEIAAMTLTKKGNAREEVARLLAGPQPPPQSPSPDAASEKGSSMATEKDSAVAYLKNLGKEASEIERLLKGPA